MTKVKCNYPESKVKHGGNQYVCKRYFVDGSDHFMCEAHAKFLMAMNPFGSKFTQVKGGKVK